MNDPLDIVPGAGAIEKILKSFTDTAAFFEDIFNQIDTNHPKKVIEHALNHAGKGLHILESGIVTGWDDIAFFGTQPILSSIMRLGFGIDTSKFDKNAESGLKTLDTMMTFIVALQYGVSAINILGKIPFAGRWAESAIEAIAEVPEEMGLSWAIGTFIETLLEAAIGRSIEEGIAEQKRPNRLGWPELRTLLKQHVLDENKADEWLKKLGYPDDQIKLIKQLVTQSVPIGDLQQMYLYDIRSKHEIHKNITAMGFSDVDADDLVAMYIDKIQTSAGSMYRSTARGLVTRDLISRHQYRAILEHTHVPNKEVEDDLAAIDLEKEHGRLSTSISTLKSLYVRGKANREHVHKELAMLGYSDGAIKDILTAWDLPSSTRPHGLSQAKILSYYMSGIIKVEDARSLLLGANLRADTVEFLLEHPSAGTGVHMRALTPGVIIEAYLAGALHVDDLKDAFKRAHVPDDQIEYFMSIAHYRKLHAKKSGDATIPLAKGDIINAFKYAIFDQSTAQQELEHLGYSSEDATILLEVENKGIFQPPTPSPFGSLSQAIAYMQGNGYTVVPPPDPMLMAAEQVLAGAGYSWYITPPMPPITTGSGH